MPYYITDQNADCSGWAVMAVDSEEVFGCHADKQSAIDQALAISLAEDVEFVGERAEGGPQVVVTDVDGTIFIDGEVNRNLLSYLESFPDTSVFVVTGRLSEDRERTTQELSDAGVRFSKLIMRPDQKLTSNEFKGVTAEDLMQKYNVMVAVDNDEGARAAYRAAGITALAPGDVPNSGTRAVDLSAPVFMQDAAKRGLEWFDAGLAGDGLVDRTVNEARAMARGEVSEDKWVRIAAWISRHLVDLESPDANPDSDNYPSAGVVAHALWGSVGGKEGALRTQAYAEAIVGRIEQESNESARGNTMTITSRKSASTVETRMLVSDFEVRETGDGMRLTGYASRFNEASEPLPFIEKVAPGAFKRSLRSKNDVKLLWNHNSDMPLASTRNGSLKLTEDDKGLFVDAILPDTTAGRDARELIQKGIVTGFSFGFSVPANGDQWSSDGNERTLKSVRLHEVSVGVSFPAYKSTEGTAQVRSLEDIAMSAEVDLEALGAALAKVEGGEMITMGEKEILMAVIDELTASGEGEDMPDDMPADESAPDEQNDMGLIDLKRKKMALLELMDTL
jgi:HK97 family phage prohead protease